MAVRYRADVGQYYRFQRGDRVTILWGRYEGATGVVDSAVFQRTVAYPENYAPGYHVDAPNNARGVRPPAIAS